MPFSNLETEAGVAALDSFLVDKSYIESYSPSQADVAVFEALKKAPAAKFINAFRWYSHIASYKIAESKKFPGVKKAASEYGPAGKAAPVSVPAAAPKAAPAAVPKAAPVVAPVVKAAAVEEDDDDLDLFGSDEEEDEENEKLKAQRVAEYNAKKLAGKPKPTAKSMIVLDVKPWDDETDMELLKKNVLAIKMEGLVWGTNKLVPVGYGIKKLSVTVVVVDDLVGVDDLIDLITADEDHVQSVDVASFNKL